MNTIETQKSAFKNKYQEKNPLLVELTNWCLEPRYQNRPTFSDLKTRINKRREEDKDMLNDIRSSGYNHKSNINTKTIDSDINSVKFGAQSNINNNGGLGLFLLKKEIKKEELPIEEKEKIEFHEGAESNNIDMFKPEANQMAEIELGYEDDFKITPEIHQKNANEINNSNFEEAFALNETEEPKINIISDSNRQLINDNDYSKDLMPVSTPMKKKRKRKQIFDESMDNYYREPTKKPILNTRRTGGNIKKGNVIGDKIFDYDNETNQFTNK